MEIEKINSLNQTKEKAAFVNTVFKKSINAFNTNIKGNTAWKNISTLP